MKTPKNVRIELVYSDPEFIRDANVILNDFVEELTIARKSSSYVGNVKRGVIRSSAIHNFASRDLQNRYDKLRIKYELTAAEFTNFFTNEEAMEEDGISVIDEDSPIAFSMPSLDDDRLTIHIHPNTTKQDLIDSWDTIKENLEFHFHNSNKRLRGPSNTKLLWAIHKARLEGKKYRQIMEEVNMNILPFYHRKKGERIEWTETDLKQFYSDYRDFVNRRA